MAKMLKKIEKVLAECSMGINCIQKRANKLYRGGCSGLLIRERKASDREPSEMRMLKIL
jgi:hypothetical protein